MNAEKINKDFRNKWRHECANYKDGCRRAAFYDNRYCYKCYLDLKKKRVYVHKLEIDRP